MDVPTTIRVNGMMATIKMINGMERVALTIALRILLSAAFSKICPLDVTTNTYAEWNTNNHGHNRRDTGHL